LEKKKVTVGQYIMFGLIAVIWAFCLIAIGFNGFGILFALGGTITVILCYGAGVMGNKAGKGIMYMADKYDDSKKQ
jgi:hypothetical protein